MIKKIKQHFVRHNDPIYELVPVISEELGREIQEKYQDYRYCSLIKKEIELVKSIEDFDFYVSEQDKRDEEIEKERKLFDFSHFNLYQLILINIDTKEELFSFYLRKPEIPSFLKTNDLKMVPKRLIDNETKELLSYVDIGSVKLVALPGELHPEEKI